jgi:hypothetical protein
MGIVVQLVTLMLLKSGLGLNYLFATALAVEITILQNFFWHEHCTWADRGSAAKFARFLKFNLTVPSRWGKCSRDEDLRTRVGRELLPSKPTDYRGLLDF